MKRKPVSPVLFACLVIAIFFGSIGIAQLTGRWYSAVTYEEYQRIVPQASYLGHP
jgi:hypothetical protein